MARPGRAWPSGRRAAVRTARRSARRTGRLLGIPLLAGLLLAPGLALVKETLPYRVPVFPAPLVPVPASAVPLLRFPAYQAAVPVLLYGDVSERQGEHTVPPRHLAEQLAVLRAAGFQSASLAQLKTLLDGVPTHLPGRPILLAFSGGLATDWTTVDPILRRYGFRGVAFVPAGSIAQRSPSYYLTEGEIRSMASSGRWEFGAEPYGRDSTLVTAGGKVRPWLTHRELRPDGSLEPLGAWRARVATDLDRSRAVLSRIVQQPVDTFAYPLLVAQFPDDDLRVAVELDGVVGERFALAFDTGGAREVAVPASPRFHVPTILVGAADRGAWLLRTLGAAIPFALPGRLDDLPYQTSGGTLTRPGPGALTISSGRFARARLRLNTDRWADYQLDAQIAGISPGTTALLAVRAGRSGEIQVLVGQSRVLVRERIRKATATLATLAWRARAPARRWQPGGATLVRAVVRTVELRIAGDVLVLRVDSRLAGPILLDQQLRTGGVSFGLIARGRCAMTFSRLRLHALDQAPSGALHQ